MLFMICNKSGDKKPDRSNRALKKDSTNVVQCKSNSSIPRCVRLIDHKLTDNGDPCEEESHGAENVNEKSVWRQSPMH